MVANLTSSVSSNLVNQSVLQFAHRRFDFPSVSFEAYFQIPNTLDMGRHVNAVDATQETRYEALAIP